MPESLARLFAEWAASVETSAVPLKVRACAQQAILDTIGVMVAGSVHPTTASIRAEMASVPGPCAIAGGDRSNASSSALVNGTAAHVWDFDDTSYTCIAHGSAVILPAVLAVVEELDCHDEDLLAAFIAGSEVAYTLGEALSQRHYYNGWWSTTTLGLIGATAGAARAYGLDAASTAHAIGMAAAGAADTRCLLGTDSKAFLVGDAARRAVDFAKAARAGLTGPLDAFEARYGFFKMFNDGHSRPDMVETLGRRWRLQDPGLFVKLSPVCSAAHAAIEATGRLVRASGVDSAEIARVRSEVSGLVKMSLLFDHPTTPAEAQFSFPYAVACAVLHGRVRLEDLDPAEVNSPAKRSIMSKVEWEMAAGPSKSEASGCSPESARIALTLASGETIEEFCGEAYGMPRRPLSAEDRWEKFRACAAFAGVPDSEIRPVLAWLKGAGPLEIRRLARSILGRSGAGMGSGSVVTGPT